VREVESSLKQYKDMPRRELLARLRKDIGDRKLVSMVVSSSPYRLPPWDFKVFSWRREFEQSEREINEESKLDFAMSGSVDIYSYEQASLLAKGYRWNPRPVFQSYSAYTPALIRLNEQHLRIAGAPDHLIFRMEPIVIESRLPSLEDGLSWPAMLDNYIVAGTANDWIYLTKKAPPIKTVSRYVPLGKVAAQLGEEVPVPTATGPIFVEVKAESSTVGKLIAVVYKAPSLTLRVTMRNGGKSIYRVNANMMETGFFLSPLVTTNEGFLRLLDPNTSPHEEDKVQSIALDVSGGRTTCWKKDYTVTFKQYEY